MCLQPRLCNRKKAEIPRWIPAFLMTRVLPQQPLEGTSLFPTAHLRPLVFDNLGDSTHRALFDAVAAGDARLLIDDVGRAAHDFQHFLRAESFWGRTGVWRRKL